MTKEEIARIIAENKDKPMVQRLLHRFVYPVRPNDDGSMSTHLMSQMDNFAYPNLQMENGEFVERSGQEALVQALRNNNAIEFGSPDEAIDFSKSYKRIWE